MLVKDAMSRDPVTVTGETHVKAALTLLAEHSLTALPVLAASGRLCGVVSEIDLIRGRVPQDPRAHEIPVREDGPGRPSTVREVMTSPAVTVRPDTELAEAVEVLGSTRAKSLPVVDDDDRVVGMLSRSDVVRVLARSDDDLQQAVGALLGSVGLAGWRAEVAEGTVALSGPEGPEGPGQRALAHLVASTVPGVMSVRPT
jgi:CBS-domain-containing membrane protein